MIRQVEITVDAQTTAKEPNETNIKLSKGLLYHVRIRPARGCNWEVYTRILHLENAIIPDHTNEWVPLEEHMLDFYPQFDAWAGIYKIKIQLCSPQARFNHTIQYDITVNEKPDSTDMISQLIEKGL